MILFFFTDYIIADKAGIFCNIITIFSCKRKKSTDENSSVFFVLYRIEQEKIVGLLMNFSELINLHRRGMTTVYSSYAGLSKTILR